MIDVIVVVVVVSRTSSRKEVGQSGGVSSG